MKRRGGRRSGSALLVALGVLTCFGILGTALALTTVSAVGHQDRGFARERAAAAAEAGVAAARAALARDPAYAGEGPVTVGTGRFSVRVRARGPAEWEVESAGAVDGPPAGAWEIRAVLRRSGAGGVRNVRIVAWDER